VIEGTFSFARHKLGLDSFERERCTFNAPTCEGSHPKQRTAQHWGLTINLSRAEPSPSVAREV
jgi:hypothetical protein